MVWRSGGLNYQVWFNVERTTWDRNCVSLIFKMSQGQVRLYTELQVTEIQNMSVGIKTNWTNPWEFSYQRGRGHKSQSFWRQKNLVFSEQWKKSHTSQYYRKSAIFKRDRMTMTGLFIFFYSQICPCSHLTKQTTWKLRTHNFSAMLCALHWTKPGNWDHLRTKTLSHSLRWS